MNKGIIIGIIVLIVIGTALVIVQANDSKTLQIDASDKDNPTPKSYTVGMTDSIGISENSSP